jgi:small conductance mechanosensitive channel
MENQMRINDVVTINGKSGLVEEINLRTTVLRGEDGVVHIFPNGSIQSLSNMTRDYSYYVLVS